VWLVDEHGVEYKSHTLGQGFTNLKKLELVKIPKLRKWVGNGPRELFSYSKVITIKDCLDDAANLTWFPKLEELEITDFPKLP
jgi:hypothetical protein